MMCYLFACGIEWLCAEVLLYASSNIYVRVLHILSSHASSICFDALTDDVFHLNLLISELHSANNMCGKIQSTVMMFIVRVISKC